METEKIRLVSGKELLEQVKDQQNCYENVVKMVNDAYIRGDLGIYKGDHDRTNVDHTKQMIEQEKMIFAISNDDVESPTGCVYLDLNCDKSQKMAELGMLCVKEDQGRKGIGMMLVTEAETRAKNHGCENMQLLNLSSHEVELPFKTVLDNWYKKLGYEIVGEVDFEEIHPVDAAMTKIRCVLITYKKQLS